MRYYCTGCPNDPEVKCCHMRDDKPRVETLDCKCVEYGVKLKGAQK